MNLGDVTIACDEADFSAILEQWWSWLLRGTYRPLLMTVFGDWFLLDGIEKVFFLDMVAGTLTCVAESQSALRTLIDDENRRDSWFLPGLVIAMRQRGMARPKGECYAYKVHPVLGGKLEPANLILLSIRVWQALCSQIHQQSRSLPADTVITGMEHLGEWEIRLLTAGSDLAQG